MAPGPVFAHPTTNPVRRTCVRVCGFLACWIPACDMRVGVCLAHNVYESVLISISSPANCSLNTLTHAYIHIYYINLHRCKYIQQSMCLASPPRPPFARLAGERERRAPVVVSRGSAKDTIAREGGGRPVSPVRLGKGYIKVAYVNAGFEPSFSCKSRNSSRFCGRRKFVRCGVEEKRRLARTWQKDICGAATRMATPSPNRHVSHIQIHYFRKDPK